MIQTVPRTVEIPQVQYVDKVVDIPVQKQRQVPMVQTVQKTVEIPQIQYIDVPVPVQKQRQVPMVQTVQETVEIPQIQYIDKVVAVPMTKSVRCPWFRQSSSSLRYQRYRSSRRSSRCQ